MDRAGPAGTGPEDPPAGRPDGRPQGFGYLGQALSSAEQVAAVFAAARPGVDRLVCSPGHYVIGPFAAAAELGLLDEDAAAGYGQNGSPVEAIGTERSPVMDYTCGSLGQGLSAALGFALSDRLRGSGARVFTMVSDGELEEGQVWEAALFAAHHHLDRLVVLLDANNSQVDGPVDSITTLEPIAAKWAAFGWHVQDLDGHDPYALAAALAGAAAARPAERGGVPHLDQARPGLPAARRGRALHQAAPRAGRGRGGGAHRQAGGPSCVSRPTPPSSSPTAGPWSTWPAAGARSFASAAT